MRKVTVFHDECCESPAEHDGSWKPYSFSTRHSNFKHPRDFNRAALGRKLQVGTAFLLSYFEHGNCVWSLRGEGPQCPWDNVDVAGVLVWEESPKHMGAKTKEERAKDARAFLEEYTAWCNGECYGFSIKDETDEVIESCGGFLSTKHMLEEIKALVGEEEIEWEGLALV